MKYLIISNSERTLRISLPDEFAHNIETLHIVDEVSPGGSSDICEMSVGCENSEMRLKINDGIFIKQDEYLVKILFTDIIYVEASRSYCYIHLTSGENLIVTYPMARLRAILPRTLFMQIHRSHIVNINYISRIVGNTVYLGEFRLPISKSSMEQFKQSMLILERHK